MMSHKIQVRLTGPSNWFGVENINLTLVPEILVLELFSQNIGIEGVIGLKHFCPEAQRFLSY